MEQERTALGSQLTERLESRLARRPRIGFSPGFYERFGFSDPWLPQAYTDLGNGGDEYTYLSGAPFREFMESLGRHRWEREQRYERQIGKASGGLAQAVASRHVQRSGRLGLFGSMSMSLPSPVVTAALTSEQDHWEQKQPMMAEARPFTHAKVSENPWLSGPTRERRVSRATQAAYKAEKKSPPVGSVATAVQPEKAPKGRAKALKTRSVSPAKGASEKVARAKDALAIDVVRENARTTLLAHKPSETESRSQPEAGSRAAKTLSRATVAPQSTGRAASGVSTGDIGSEETQATTFAPSGRTAQSHTQRAAQRAEQVSFESSPLVNRLRDMAPALSPRVQSALAAVLSDQSINSERSDEMVRSIIRKGGVPRAIRVLLEERLSLGDRQPMSAAISRAAPETTQGLQPVLSKSPVVGALLNPAAAFAEQIRADEALEGLVAPARQTALRANVEGRSSEGRSRLSAHPTSRAEVSSKIGASSSRMAPQSSWAAARSAYGTAPTGRAVRTLAPKIVSPVREEASVRVSGERANRSVGGRSTLLTPFIPGTSAVLDDAQGFENISRSKSGVPTSDPLHRATDRKEKSDKRKTRGTEQARADRSPTTRVLSSQAEGLALDESRSADGESSVAHTERTSRLSLESPTQTSIEHSSGATDESPTEGSTVDSPSATVWAAKRGGVPTREPVPGATDRKEKSDKRKTRGTEQARADRSPTRRVLSSQDESLALDESRSADGESSVAHTERTSRLSLESPTQTSIEHSPSATVWAAERGDVPASDPVYRATSALSSHVPFAVSRALGKAPDKQRFVPVQIGREALEKSSLVRGGEVTGERRAWDRSTPTTRSGAAGVTRVESQSGRPVRWPAATASLSLPALQYSHVQQSTNYASTTTPQDESWYEAPSRRVSGRVNRGEITRVQRSTGAQSDRYLGATKFLSVVSGGSSARSRRGELGGGVAPVSGSRRWRGKRVPPTSITARGIVAEESYAPMNIESAEAQTDAQYSGFDDATAGGRKIGLRQRDLRQQGVTRAPLSAAAPSLMQTLGDVARGDQSQSAPPWAERALGGPAMRGTGDLIQSLARASSSEDVVRIIMDRGERMASSAELPSSTLEVVRQIQSEAKSELPRQRNLDRRSLTSSQAPSMSGLGSSGGGRNYRPARRVSGWTGKPRQSVHGASGVGDDRIMKLAKRLKGLVLLAENSRRDEARKQVRLAANEAPKTSPSPSGKGGDASPGQLEALIQEVVQAVGRELEMRRERTQEESDGWW